MSENRVRLAVVGEFDPEFPPHAATNEGIDHAAQNCGVPAEVREEYYCDFGLNPDHQEALHAAGLRVVGRDEDDEARVLELPGHPFFVATLFVPPLRSTPEDPHPLVRAFLSEAADAGAETSTSTPGSGV